MHFDKGSGEQALSWMFNEWRKGETHLHRWLDTDARWNYTKSCLNYLIACGLNNGEIESSGANSRRAWAVASSGYGAF